MLPGADIQDGKVIVREEEDEETDAGKEAGQSDEALASESSDDENDDGKSTEGVEARAPVANEKDRKGGKKAKSHLPQVFLLSSGEVNPFTLTIGSTNEPAMFYRLRGKFDGSIHLEGPIEGDLIADMDKPWQGEKRLDNDGNEIDDEENDDEVKRD
jgi:hypothetical protein